MTPDPIARQSTLIAWMIASAENGLTTWEIARHWKSNPGTTAILNRLNWLVNLGFVSVETRVNAPKVYKWSPRNALS